MNAKKLVLVLGLVALVLVIPASYVLAHPAGYYYSVADDMEQNQEKEWRQEMHEYMEQHWEDVENEGGWNEMRQYMEEYWNEQDSNGQYGSYGSYGGCHRWVG